MIGVNVKFIVFIARQQPANEDKSKQLDCQLSLLELILRVDRWF